MVQGSNLLTGNVVAKRSVSGKSIRARLNSDQEVQPHVSSGAIPQKIPTGEDYGAGVGRAISGLGNIFGNVLAKIRAQEEKNKFANARLDFENADREIRDNIRKNPDLVDGAPELYDQTKSSIIKKYGFEKDPDKELYFTQRANTRVHHYADIKQQRAVEGFIANENSSIDKAVNAIVADPTPETRDRVLSSLDELVENSVGSYRTMAQALERKQELKEHLSLKYIEKLKETDPDKAEAELKAFKAGRVQTFTDDKEVGGKSVLSYSRNLDKLVPANRKDGRIADIDNLKPEFKTKLQKLQQSVGKNLIINSGYRDQAHNKKVGGATNSRHMHRDAVDLQWPKGATVQEKQQIIAHAVSLGFKGYGIGDGILHLDMGRGRFWGYKNGKPTGNVPTWAVAALSGKVKPANENKGDVGIQGKIASAAKEAGLDPDYMVRLADAESSFRAGVEADTSSATGLFQITKGTADRLGRSHGKKSIDEEIADGIAITKANQATLKNYLGRTPTNDELHLAHVFGAGRANGILSAKNETPIDRVLPPEVIAANKSGIFKTVKTVGQLKAWAKAKQNSEVKITGSLQRAPVQSKRSKFVEKEIVRLEKSIAEAVEAKREAQVKDALKGNPSAAIDILVDGYRDQLAKDPNNSGLQTAIKVGDQYLKQQKSSLKNDPLKYADDQGLVDVPSIIGQQDPVKAISERIKQGDEVAQIYQIEPKYLRQEEKAFLSKQFHELPAQEKLQFLAGIDKGAGSKAKKILSEMNDLDPAFAHIGGLYLVGRKEAAMLAMQGMDIMKDKSLKDATERLKGADVNAAFDAYFGNAFGPSSIKAAGPFLTTAKAIAITKMVQDSSLTPSAALEEGMKLATGHTEVNGEQYGGVIEFNDQSLMVHPDHRAADYEDVFEYLTSRTNYNPNSARNARRGLERDDGLNFFLQKDGVNPTHPVTQRPITAEDLNDAQFVSVGVGRVMIMVDGVPLLDTRKAKNLGEGKHEFGRGSEYILDLGNELEESLKLVN